MSFTVKCGWSKKEKKRMQTETTEWTKTETVAEHETKQPWIMLRIVAFHISFKGKARDVAPIPPGRTKAITKTLTEDNYAISAHGTDGSLTSKTRIFWIACNKHPNVTNSGTDHRYCDQAQYFSFFLRLWLCFCTAHLGAPLKQL